MTWHSTVELPAHLPVGFFDSELSTSLIEVLELYSVSLLRPSRDFVFIEGLQLGLECPIRVSASDQGVLTEQSAVAQDFKRVTDAFTYDSLINLVLLTLILTVIFAAMLLLVFVCIHCFACL